MSKPEGMGLFEDYATTQGDWETANFVRPELAHGEEVEARIQQETLAMSKQVDMLARIIERPPWQERAACKGPQSELFFQPINYRERKDERIAREARAKAICATCVVRQECLNFALKNKEKYGIWGGTTEEERRRVLVIQRRTD